MSRIIIKRIFLISGLALWISGVVWGMKWLGDYSFKPGAAGVPAETWPAGATLKRDAAKFTLIVALHPECPCSRATLSQIDSILVQSGGAVDAVVIFSDSVTDTPAKNSPLYQQAVAMPRVRIVCDDTGGLLRSFAFRTSGEARLYHPDGTLAFCGGITPSRGHMGDNPGQSAVIAAVLNQPGPGLQAGTPVFGCSLGLE
jgi:hypothetical protein